MSWALSLYSRREIQMIYVNHVYHGGGGAATLYSRSVGLRLIGAALSRRPPAVCSTRARMVSRSNSTIQAGGR
jgi:hypothetical protein